jgi:fibronectin type 3 domain-containing protein
MVRRQPESGRHTARNASLLTAVLLACTLPAAARAQGLSQLPFWLIPDTNRVNVIIAQTPSLQAEFTVARQEPGGGEFRLLTAEPVAPVLDPLEARGRLGEEEYAWLSQAVGSDDEFTLWHRLRGDAGLGGILSLASPKLARALGRVFVDTTVSTGQQYTYRIMSYDVAHESLSSFESKVLVRPHVPPKLRASRLAASARNELVRLEWQYPKYPVDKSDVVVGFRVYRRQNGQTDFQDITPHLTLRTGETLFYRDEQVVNEQPYEYYVAAVDIVGAEGPPSERISVTPRDTLGPEPPGVIAAVPLEGAIRVEWPAPADRSRLSGYNIYRSYSINGAWTRLNAQPLSPGDTTFTDTTVVGGQPYVYTVRPLNRKGREGRASPGAYGGSEDRTPPPPPGDLKVRPEKRAVRLTWTSHPVSDLAGYHVYRRYNPLTVFRLDSVTIPKGTTTWLDSGFNQKGLDPGGHYRYEVSQVDFNLNESQRETASVLVPDDEPPLAPLSIYCQVTDSGTVEVSWQRSLSSDVQKYQLCRQEAGKPVLAVYEGGANASSWLDDKLVKGKLYTYWVVTIDSAGNQSRSDSQSVLARDIVAPPAPQGFQARLAGKQVELSWTTVAAADLAGYNVYRSSFAGGTADRLNSSPLSGLKLTDSKGGAEYWYWVKAVDTSGNEGRASQNLQPRH